MKHETDEDAIDKSEDELLTTIANKIVSRIILTNSVTGYELRNNIKPILQELINKVKTKDQVDYSDPDQMLLDVEAEKSKRLYDRGE